MRGAYKKRQFVFACALLMVTLSFVALPVFGQQEVPSSPVINAGNVEQLASRLKVNFDEAPFENIHGNTGWFAINDDASMFAIIRSNGLPSIWSIENELENITGTHASQDFDWQTIDATFDFGFVALQSSEIGYWITTNNDLIRFPESQGIPLNIWGDLEGNIWLETMPIDSTQEYSVYSISLLNDPTKGATIVPLTLHTDPTAIARIGRIPPPFAVTSSEDELVKLWNLQTGEVVSQAEIEGGPAVFGQINASGTHLAWRDPQSLALHLLDFTTGEDKIVAQLDGEYLQFMFLTPDADVIIGVNVDLEPIVVAWNTETGERYELGEYRECNRVPDMARLSKDGTTLVIGCDTGLDIWRVSE